MRKGNANTDFKCEMELTDITLTESEKKNMKCRVFREKLRFLAENADKSSPMI